MDDKWDYDKIAGTYVFMVEEIDIHVTVSPEDLKSALINYSEYRYPTFLIDKEGFSGQVQIPYEVLEDAFEGELEEGYKEKDGKG